MGISKAQITDAMRKRMSKREQQIYGKPFEDQVAELEEQAEETMHEQYSSYLYRHGFRLVIHADMDRKVHDLPIGWPDYTVSYGPPLQTLYVEFKAGRNKLTPEQDAYRNLITVSGGTYVVARSFKAAMDATIQFFNLGDPTE